ncbi:hypothetical protein [Alkalibacter saccharofermentans]|uniref:Uncharacterized protein n=1 Tax=Alkalibacter saccharofermentans DSM 14828 TaxID=1120975 RepID=A0A1M4UVE1_9FIRM|nr:hypothetical protein [Alkalibacter saccharofermentans]SHE60639.1 hypothetical protein SAMN02746064_00834 [Alkalibacter saccharofermentans DSM 14828]
MKRKILILTVIVMLLVSVSSSVFAAGMPAAHGLTGAEFGQAVSSLPPGAIAAHVSGR